MNDKNEIFINFEDKKVCITINKNNYELSSHFSACDSRKYAAELSAENDYKKAIATIIYDKLKQNNNCNFPSLQDIIDTEDSAFTEYILAVVAKNSEFKACFEETDKSIEITKRFCIAHKAYTDIIGKRLSEAMRPIIESCNNIAKSIDFSWLNKMQELANRSVLAWSDTMMNITQQIANVMQPFHELAVSMASSLSKINIPSISEEEKKQWEKTYIQWGKIGWTVLPNAPFNFYNGFPESIKEAHAIAMKYCDAKAMNDLFISLYEQKVKKSDLESAIYCYKNKQYKACSLLLFSLIDSKLIKIQPKNQNRVVGWKAVNKLKSELSEKTNEEYYFMFALYNINLMTCLDTYFSGGNGFIKEPSVINRNFIDHGMDKRTVRKRDCIQLFLALYNLLEFLDMVNF